MLTDTQPVITSALRPTVTTVLSRWKTKEPISDVTTDVCTSDAGSRTWWLISEANCGFPINGSLVSSHVVLHACIVGNDRQMLGNLNSSQKQGEVIFGTIRLYTDSRLHVLMCAFLISCNMNKTCVIIYLPITMQCKYAAAQRER